MSKPNGELTPRMQELFALFELDKDVTILGVYERFFDHPPEVDRRRAQQHLGSYITKLNRRLKRRRLAVRPGRLKETYRLVSTR